MWDFHNIFYEDCSVGMTSCQIVKRNDLQIGTGSTLFPNFVQFQKIKVYSEDEDWNIYWDFSKYLPNHTASYPRRLKPSTAECLQGFIIAIVDYEIKQYKTSGISHLSFSKRFGETLQLHYLHPNEKIFFHMGWIFQKTFILDFH